MEENIKQHIITPLKGICNAPSDLTCEDEQLSVCDGMVNVNGELQPIQKPDGITEYKVHGKLLYVHIFNNTKRWVYLTNDGNYHLYFSTGSSDADSYKWLDNTHTYSENIQVTSVGKTLIVNSSDGIHYYLWQDAGYKDLGTQIPKPEVLFYTQSAGYASTGTSVKGMISADNPYPITCVTAPDGGQIQPIFRVTPENTTTFENAYMGAYAELKNMIYEKGGFYGAFFVRYALEMYDGSYMYISNPVLIYANCISRADDADDNFADISNCYAYFHDWEVMYSLMHYSKLYVNSTQSYTDYNDIVKGVAIFMSRPVDLMRERHAPSTNESFKYMWYSDGFCGEAYSPGYALPWQLDEYIYKTPELYNITEENAYTSTSTQRRMFSILKPRKDSDIIEELKDSSVFYKLCTLGVAGGEGINIADHVSSSKLKNLTTLESLGKDDFHGWCSLSQGFLHTQNKRLSVVSPYRDLYKGFLQMSNLFMGLEYDEDVHNVIYHVIVRLRIDGGYRFVRTITGALDITRQFLYYNDKNWFFYPDTRADKVAIYAYVKGNFYLQAAMDLAPHYGLNGAYSLASYVNPYSNPLNEGGLTTKEGMLGYDDYNSYKEFLYNEILQSDVANPWYFTAESYTRVGDSEIIGIAALTTALSQDAYKVATTLCFTKQGIWALLCNDEGIFSQVPPVFSREVCTDADTITLTDNAVFFVSKKGLMCVTAASESNVICVSNQLSGTGRKAFLDFLNGCKIAYDYRSNKLVLFRTDTSKVWIYDIASQTFSTKDDYLGGSKVPLTVVGDYPDNIIQNTDYGLYTLYYKPLRDEDTNTYDGEIESRPMKLDGSLYLKSLRRLREIMMLNENAKCTLTLYGSNDLKKWNGTDEEKELTKLTSIHGKPYRFFKYHIKFENLKATDTFSGLLLDTQVRYTDRPH